MRTCEESLLINMCACRIPCLYCMFAFVCCDHMCALSIPCVLYSIDVHFCHLPPAAYIIRWSLVSLLLSLVLLPLSFVSLLILFHPFHIPSVSFRLPFWLRLLLSLGFFDFSLFLIAPSTLVLSYYNLIHINHNGHTCHRWWRANKRMQVLNRLIN